MAAQRSVGYARPLRATARLCTSRMAPRAGFEVGRKLLNAHVDTALDQLNTPNGTPPPSALGFNESDSLWCKAT